MAKQISGILKFIGNTPLLEVTHLDCGCCKLFLKLENQNPGGSIKDRIGLAMIETAEQEGKLKAGGHIFEATAGNTGLGLALVAASKGYPITLVIPDKMSREKIAHLRALGAKIVLTRSDVEKGHPEYYQDLAENLAKKIPGAFYANQFNNAANPLAHEKTTGPEIWEQLEHHVDTIVCGVGSGGTVTGLSRFFARVSPKTEFVLADPEGSVLAEYVSTKHFGKAGSWVVEGIGEDFLPPLLDLSRVKTAYSISDKESFSIARQLLATEGVLAGSSSGTLIAAALRYCKEQTSPKKVVTFVCDTGNKYLSKMYSDEWMFEQGFLEEKKYGDLRDVVSRRACEGQVISIEAKNTVSTAWKRMQTYGLSFLPVYENKQVIGIISDTDIAKALKKEKNNMQGTVQNFMKPNFVTLEIHDSLSEVLNLLDKNIVPVIVFENSFYGLISRSDVINYLIKASKA